MTFGKIGSARTMAVWPSQGYAPNGLIAMWDAADNAGFGEHNPSATVWRDLSGNGHDLAVDLSQAKWFDDYLRVTGVTCTRDEGLAGIVTLEVIFRDTYTKTYTDNKGSYFSIGERKGPYCGWYAHMVGGDITATNVSSNLYKYAKYGNRHLNTYVYSPSPKYYENAVSLAVYRAPVKAMFSGAGIEARAVSPSPGIEITVARAYNRALTAAEIAHNYSIDCARFGIGGGV